MKNSVLTPIISKEATAALYELSQDVDRTFGELVNVSGLDRKRDFRFADLRGLDFSNSDLRGYDFSGADLTGTFGVGAIVDETTVFLDAIIEDSIFSARLRLKNLFESDDKAKALLDMVSRQDWAGQILWSGKNIMQAKSSSDIALSVTEALFYQATDGFLKAELLSYLTLKIRSTMIIRELLLRSLSEFSHSTTLVKKCLYLLNKSKLSQDKTIRRTLMALINNKSQIINIEVLSFLIKTSRDVDELNLLRLVACRKRISYVYVREISMRLGEAYDLITRDPITNETFTVITSIQPLTKDLIERRWARAEANRQADNTNKSLVDIKSGLAGPGDYVYSVRRARRIEQMWGELKAYGINISVEQSAISERAPQTIETGEGLLENSLP